MARPKGLKWKNREREGAYERLLRETRGVIIGLSWFEGVRDGRKSINTKLWEVKLVKELLLSKHDDITDKPASILPFLCNSRTSLEVSY